MTFEPIAVVGRGCVLPGANAPDPFWRLIRDGRDLIGHAPRGHWRLDHRRVLRQFGSDLADAATTDTGGYISGFDETFDPTGLDLPMDRILALDPLLRWLLDAAHQAQREAGLHAALSTRTGVIIGNLSYPTESLSRFAEAVWLEQQGQTFLDGRAVELAGIAPPAPENRFMSGLPAHLVAQALGAHGPAFCLDAACASSLYAIKLGCDRLHDREVDFVIAGAVNRADDLFLHTGFTALQALSRTGRSRPFNRHADGLLPAEGAGCVVLERLADAEAAGRRIFGVIRGIGLSNDGRAGGVLRPDASGQIRAMQAAYAQSGLEPADVSLVECHATGTQAGDAVEIRSMAAIFDRSPDVPIGSHKSNLGHLITASGMAGLLKILGALQEGVRPPTLHAEPALDELADTQFRLLHRAEAWTAKGLRRAAINNFGFGGNNAHLLVEEWRPTRRPRRVARRPADAVVIVGMGACVGDADGCDALARVLFGDTMPAAHGRTRPIDLPMKDLRLPPADLKSSLGQQVMMLRASWEAARDARLQAGERTGVVIGMQCDAEIARHGFRLRLPDWGQAWSAAGYPVDGAWLDEARDALCDPLKPAFVVGSMPNMPANRLNAQFDLREFGFTVSSEELSGLVALETAARALRHGEIDAAIVGAVDLCCEPVHEAAAAAVLPESRRRPGDGAVAFVLKRRVDAEKQGNRIYAVLAGDDPEQASLTVDLVDAPSFVTARLGHAHAASGLMHVAAAALACAARARFPSAEAGAQPWLPLRDGRRAATRVATFSGQRGHVALASDPGSAGIRLPGLGQPRLRAFAGRDRRELLARLEAETPGGEGPVRLAAVGSDNTWRAQREAALASLRSPSAPRSGELASGTYFGESPVGGELAFVFTGAAAAYAGAGRDLLLALPLLADRVANRFGIFADTAAWLYDGSDGAEASPFEQLKGATFLSQVHAELSRRLLGLSADAALGLSSGETNALFAFGAWRDMDAMYRDIAASGLYGTHLTGEFSAARKAWADQGSSALTWRNWHVLAPVDAVTAVVHDEPRVHVTIINSAADCVIAGDAAACDRVIRRIGRERCMPMGHDMIVHCPEVRPFADVWRAVHTRETVHVPGVRFYTNASGTHYELTSGAVADALLGQALNPIDFRRTVEAAWADGVRVFVEHGPRDALTSAIKATLGDRPHVAVSLDRFGRSALEQVLHAAAQLHVAGVNVDIAGVTAALDAISAPGCPLLEAARPASVSVPAHLPAIRFRSPVGRSTKETGDETMSPAPALPRVADLPPPLLEQAQKAPHQLSPEEPAALPAPAEADRHPIVALVSQATERHQTFLADMIRAHRHFLELQTSAALGQGGAAAVALAPRPAAPPTPERPRPRPASPQARERAPEHGARPKITFGRRELEIHASGRISEIFGGRFATQDEFSQQVRMPSPPLLLADRVTDLAGEPGSMGRGTAWTETDVAEGAWYLHHNRMSPGIVIESGQADLLLISWLGADFRNRGERVYRLLGCELTFHGDLPKPGDTLKFDIHVDGHARTGDVGLFFFHYDCRIGDAVRLSVRNGQAGFFTAEELAASRGVLWSAEDDRPKADARRDPPHRLTRARAFGPDCVRVFAGGDAYACFGNGFELAAAHQRTPTIPSGRLQPFDEVTAFEPDGGPWQRGYLRAEAVIPTDHWFYDGHFKNDPCMPGTLMADAAVQAMAFYLAALGYTIERDGWRFEPVPGDTFKFVCRGQVVPDAPHRLVYEVFVEEIVAEPRPTLYAALLCTCDGLKVFHCRRFGLTLVPDWPLAERQGLLPKPPAAHFVHAGSDIRGDYAALLACAWGPPSEAFASLYRKFDGGRRVPRLPGPPYHFMSRVVSVDCPPGRPAIGAAMEAVYDVPVDAWYFEENGYPTMPFCVLLECMLQPCGWLGSYLGLAANAPTEVFFRNLDGDNAVQQAEVTPESGQLVVRLKITNLARLGSTSLLFLRVESFVGDRPVMSFDTSFGFVDAGALRRQTGLPEREGERQRLTEPSAVRIDLRERPPELFSQPAHLAGSRLTMIDEITNYSPAGADGRSGRIRGRQRVEPGAWYFKAHFYQDPVQAGSLGLEALVQLLQSWMLLSGLGRDLELPRFQAVALDEPMTWKYRGQVLPDSREVVTLLDVVRVTHDATGVVAAANGSLWVDGMKIYEVTNLAVRIVARGGARKPVSVGGPAVLDADGRLRLSAVRGYWRSLLHTERWPVEDVFLALVNRFVDRISVVAPADYAAHAGRPVLYLANHQVGIESVVFAVLGAVLGDRPVVTIAKDEHRSTWLGQLLAVCEAYPGVQLPHILTFFDRSDQASMLEVADGLRRRIAEERVSLLVHVEGTRALQCRKPVSQVSGVMLDLAVAAGLPIVPVRFAGALPVEPSPRRLEYPIGYGRQTIYLGGPIAPEDLKPLPLIERKQLVLDAINRLGNPAEEVPVAPDPQFATHVAEWVTAGLPEERAALLQALLELDDRSDTAKRLLDCVRDGGRLPVATPIDAWLVRLSDWFLDRAAGPTPSDGQ